MVTLGFNQKLRIEVSTLMFWKGLHLFNDPVEKRLQLWICVCRLDSGYVLIYEFSLCVCVWLKTGEERENKGDRENEGKLGEEGIEH